MKNKLQDLNNHLFAQLERLSDEDQNAVDIDREILRAKGLIDVSEQIIKLHKLALDAIISINDKSNQEIFLLSKPSSSDL